MVETGMGYGPYGTVGIGEDVATVLPALIGPAIHNALGVWIDGFPVTPARVLAALEATAGWSGGDGEMKTFRHVSAESIEEATSILRAGRRQGAHHRRRHRPAGRDEGRHPARGRLPRGARQHQEHPRSGLRREEDGQPAGRCSHQAGRPGHRRDRAGATTRRWPRPPARRPRRTSARWAPSPATSARTTAAGTTGCRTTPSTACARAARPATRCPATPGTTPSSAPPGWEHTACTRGLPQRHRHPRLPGKIRQGDIAGRGRDRADEEPAAGGHRAGLPALRARASALGASSTSRSPSGRSSGSWATTSSTNLERLLRGARAGDREAGGRHRFRAGRALGGLLPQAGRARGHRVRAHAARRAVFSPTGSRRTGCPARCCASRWRAIERTGIEFALGAASRQGPVRRRSRRLRRRVRRLRGLAGDPGGHRGRGVPAVGHRVPRAAANLEKMAGKTIGVIGGGNTAIDVARSLLRRGREAGHLLPAHQGRDARSQGRGGEGRAGGRALLVPDAAGGSRGGGRRGVADLLPHGARATWTASGRPRPVRVEGSEFAERCDVVVKAIVEKPDYSFLPADFVDETRQAEDRQGRLSAGQRRLRRRRLRHRPGDGGPGDVRRPGRRPRPSTATCWAADRPPRKARRSATSARPSTARACRRAAGWRCRSCRSSERLRSLDVEETGTLDAGGGARRRPTAASTAAAWRSTRPTWLRRSSPWPPRCALRSGSSPPRTSSLSGSTRSTVLDDGEMVLEVEVPQAGAGHAVGVHQVRPAQVHRLPGGQLRGGGGERGRRGEVGAHLSQLGVRPALQGRPRPRATWSASPST